MPALETLGQYLEEARRLLQDEFEPYRYPSDDMVDALNIAMLEARRLRADLFLPSFTIPWFDPTKTAPGSDLAKPVPFDPMYRQSLVYYIVGRMQLRDDEGTTDARAASLMTKFTAQMISIQS
jgi:hypothetical protein